MAKTYSDNFFGFAYYAPLIGDYIEYPFGRFSLTASNVDCIPIERAIERWTNEQFIVSGGRQ